MNNCTFAALCSAIITGLLVSASAPTGDPDKYLMDQNTALIADNVAMQERMAAFMKEQIAEEKKRTEAALKGCAK